MLNIDVKFSGNTKERIEALINGFDKKRGVLMGKIAKRMKWTCATSFCQTAAGAFGRTPQAAYLNQTPTQKLR